MPTPSSGQQISIQDIVNEFGGSAPHGLKEYYTEAGIASGNQISIKDFYDLSAGPTYLDTQTVTVGSDVSQYVTWRGYSASSPVIGSISDGTSNIYSGSVIKYIRNLNNSTTQLRIQGVHSNSGWTTMTINGVDFARADASFSTNTDSQWVWSPTNNPFGTTDGVEVTVTWI